MNLRQIIKETIHKALLKEYFDAKPQRLPFGDDFYKDEHIYDYVNWLKQAGKIGKLPKPKFTWDEGLKKGCIEYVKKYGSPELKIGNKDNEIYKTYEYVKDRLDPVVMFDDNGNLYVERAITVKEGTNYFQLIDEYQNNPGGCWSLRVNSAKAYCSYGDGTPIVLHGYMFLDDIFWAELIRKSLCYSQDEWEVRTYPNGKVQITAMHIDGQYVNLEDSPIIINSTYFGNNQRYVGDVAPLGYQKIGYEYNFIDRKGNLIKNLSDTDLSRLIKNNFEKEDLINILRFTNFGLAVVNIFGKSNYVNKKGDVLSPNLWFDICERFNNDAVARVIVDHKHNFINLEGEFLWNKPVNEWFDETPAIFLQGFTAVCIKTEDGEKKWNLMNTNGDFILNKPVNEWFDKVGLFSTEGIAAFSLEGKCNYIRLDGSLLYDKPIDEWFDKCESFKKGFGYVSREVDFDDENAKPIYKRNLLTTDGELLSPNLWFDSIDSFEEGFAIVKIGNKYNYISLDGEFLWKKPIEQWFDYCTEMYKDKKTGITYSEVNLNNIKYDFTSDGKLIKSKYQ